MTYSCAEIAQVGEDLGQLKALHFNAWQRDIIFFSLFLSRGRKRETRGILVWRDAVGEFGCWCSS
jgi:hypothetical protein